MTIQVRKLTPHFAAEVEGVDLRNLQEGEAEAIRDAFYEHSVLVFHGQSLSPRELARFGETFGDPEPHVALKYRHPEVPEVSYITNVKPDGSVDPMGTTRAQSWHTDGSFMKKSSALAILHSLEAVSSGGETLFSSTRAAHDALSEGMRESLVGLRAIHSYAAGPASKGSNVPLAKEQEGLYPPVEHPIVRTHPHTGRKALFINPQHTCGIVGMPLEEAMDLLDHLLQHATSEEFRYKHAWRTGDVVMWDQAATLHRGTGGFPAHERRIMIRTIVGGTEAPF